MPTDNEMVNLIKGAAQEGQFDKMSTEEMENIYNYGHRLVQDKPYDEALIKAINQFRKEIAKRKNNLSVMTKPLRFIAIILFSIICIICSAYVIVTQGEPYQFAVQFINDSSLIISKIGPLKSSHLSFPGYSVRYSGPHGYAEFKIAVTGVKDSGDVYLNLEKSEGNWKVIKGNLVLEDGVSVPILSFTSTNTNEVILYTTIWCPSSKQAREFFNSRNIRFTDYDVEKDAEAYERKKQLDTCPGVPLAIINGKKFCGFNPAEYEKALK
jgi:glutaredoxin